MFHAECCMEDVGCRMLDGQSWMLDVGCWMLGVVCCMLHVRMADAGENSAIMPPVPVAIVSTR